MARTRWAWLLVVAAAASGIVEAALMRRDGVGLLSVTALQNAFPAVNVATVIGTLVGAVIVARHPRHRIGWLFCWGQFGVALGLLTRAASDGLASGALQGPGWLAQLTDLAADLLGSQFALVLLGCLLLLAPDGVFLTPRWRFVLVLLVSSYALTGVSLVLFLLTTGATAPALPADGTSLDLLIATGQIGVVAGLALSVVGLVVRLKRSRGELRQQLRWITVAASVLGAAPVTAVMLNLLGTIPTPIWVVLVLHLGYLGVPVATGFAVLRYRLYDVDRIVGGSVVLAVLVVLAGAGYVLAVGLVGVVAANEQSTLFSLVIFVVVVLVFQPIRSTVRRLADRFVYGPQSMSYEALTTFTRQLSSSTTEPFLDGVAEAAGRLVSARGCRAVLILEDGTELTSSWSSTGAHSPAGAGTTDVSSDWLIPVVHGATTLGRLELSMPELAAGSGRRRQLLQAFGQRVAAGFDHARLELSLRESAEQLKEMNHQLVQSRQRLLAAKDIGQRQVATKMRRDVIDPLQSVSPRLEQVAELALTDPTAAAREVGLALQSTTVAIQQLRAITSTVYSRVLVERGLVAALRAESWPAGVSLELRGSAERWSPLVESALFACCIDFIRTARGHVVVQLVEQSAQTIELTLNRPQMSDDDEWLATTTERIEVMGGHVVRLRPDTVRLRLPVVEARAAAEHASRQLQP